LRIIGGKFRGRRVEPPAGFKARPTTDFAREGLFNILQNRFDLEECVVLDLFAGTGAISFEFSSRGAMEVYLVEKDLKHLNGIRTMMKSIGLENIKPIHIDVAAFLKTCKIEYDIVFADPPYDLKWFSEVPEMVLSSGVLKKTGIFILEHPRNMEFSQNPRFSEQRNYGGVHFSFFKGE